MSTPVKSMIRPPQVCDHCAGPFGLVRHRWWGARFYRRRCKDGYLREILLARDKVAQWPQLLLDMISAHRRSQKGSRVAPVARRARHFPMGAIGISPTGARL
jgi:hypothetical protein